jgi:hypothetical protein
MAEGRLPKIALKWMPKQKRAGGRPKKNWMEVISKAMMLMFPDHTQRRSTVGRTPLDE